MRLFTSPPPFNLTGYGCPCISASFFVSVSLTESAGCDISETSKKAEEYSLKSAFSRFRKPFFLCFSARSRNPVQASRLFSLKDLESKDRVPGQGFDSLHLAKLRKVLAEQQIFSVILVSFPVQKAEKNDRK